MRRPYPSVGRNKFLARLEPLMAPAELENIETAYVLAKYGHRDQYRDGGRVRYFEHPKAVAWIAVTELRITDWRTVVLALLHDVKEDSYILSWHRIQVNFGRDVTVGLRLLTKRPKRAYVKRLAEHGAPRVVLIKLCDRLHNLRTLGSCDRRKQRRQIVETLENYVPLADVLIAKLPKKDRWRGEWLKREILALCERHIHGIPISGKYLVRHCLHFTSRGA